MKTLAVLSFALLAACGSKATPSETPAAAATELPAPAAETDVDSSTAEEKEVAWERVPLGLSTASAKVPVGTTKEVTTKEGSDSVETSILSIDDFVVTIGYERGGEDFATLEDFNAVYPDLAIIKAAEMSAGYVVVSEDSEGKNVTAYVDEGFIFCKASGLSKEQMLKAVSVCASFEI